MRFLKDEALAAIRTRADYLGDIPQRQLVFNQAIEDRADLLSHIKALENWQLGLVKWVEDRVNDMKSVLSSDPANELSEGAHTAFLAVLGHLRASKA